MSKLIEKVKKYLCPPGNGVFTVHTAKELKRDLHTRLYGTVDPKEVESKWHTSLSDLDTHSEKAVLLGVTSDSGGGIQRGANWGPLFIRNAMGEELKNVYDIGDVRTIPHLLHDKYLNDETIKSCQSALYQGQNLPASPLSITQDFSKEFFTHYPNRALISLGGDHSVSYPLVKSWIEAKKEKNIKTAIIHFDAHTDLMDKRLGIDICFASWAYHMLEILDKPSDLIQFGIRSSGQPKKFWTSSLGVQQYWAQDFNQMGIDKIISETLSYLRKRKIDEVYISFDIDFLDSSFASSTGTPETGGLTPSDGVAIIEAVGKEFKVTGADLVEVAPFVSSYMKDSSIVEPDRTLQSSKEILNKMIEVINL